MGQALVAIAEGSFRRCKRCEKDKPISCFQVRNPKNGTRRLVCHTCVAKQRSPEKLAARLREQTWRQHGIKLKIEEYEALLVAQGGRCAICREEPTTRRLAADHCHSTGKVRGLLCTDCNQVLGKFRDDPQRFENAAQYLRFHFGGAP